MNEGARLVNIDFTMAIQIINFIVLVYFFSRTFSKKIGKVLEDRKKLALYEMEIVEINTEFIKLDQLLKWANFTASGVESKMFILNGEVKVNGEVETRRGKKIYDGYIVEFNGEKIKVKAPTE